MDWRRWYAFDAVFDSLYKLRYYFVPFDLWRYVALVVVTAVVGSRAGYGAVGDVATFAVGVEADLRLTRPAVELAVDNVDLFAAAVALLAVLVFVSAVFEFVFVDILWEDDLSLRKLFSQRLREGFSLFVFRVAATAAFFLSSYVAVGLLRNSTESTAGLIPLAAAVALLALGFSVVNGLVTDFAVPIMIADGRRLDDAVVEVVKLFRREPRQLSLYVGVRLLLNAAILVGATVVSVVVAATIGLPLAGLGYAVELTSGGLDAALATAAGVAVAVVLVAIYLVLLLVFLAVFVQLPVRFYLRCYPLYVLGYTDERYRLLEERPADISLLDFLLGRK